MPPPGRTVVKQAADDGGRQTDVGHEAVGGLPTGVEAESIEAEQGAVGVGGHGVNGVQDVIVAYGLEKDDAGREGKHECQMYPATDAPGRSRVGVPVLYLQEVDTHGGGEGGQCGVCTGESCRHNAYGEGHDDPTAQHALTHQPRQEFIAHGRRRKPLAGTEGVEQNAQCQEEGIDGQEGQAVGEHIFLRIAQMAAGEVFLHHVLVKSGHHDNDEHAAEELPPEGLPGGPVPLPHPAHGALSDGLHHAAEVQPHRLCRSPEHAHGGQDEATGLQRIGPHNGLYAGPAGVEPDEAQHGDHREQKREEGIAAQGTHHETMEHQTDEVEARSSTGELAQHEEQGSGAMGGGSEAGAEPRIDAGEPQTVVKGQQDPGHHGITDNEAHAHLQIGHACGSCPAGNGDEGYSGNAGTDHTDGHEPPGRLPTGTEEGVVALRTPTGGTTGDEEQHKKVGHQRGQHEKSGHYGKYMEEQTERETNDALSAKQAAAICT